MYFELLNGLPYHLHILHLTLTYLDHTVLTIANHSVIHIFMPLQVNYMFNASFCTKIKCYKIVFFLTWKASSNNILILLFLFLFQL